MAIFSSFLGQNEGYTKAQRTGLRRSAEIKKRRKEEEKVFEREKIRAESKRALTERGIMEAGETRRAGMREVSETARRRMADVGMMARERLGGKRAEKAATTKAFREAEAMSVKRGHELSLEEIKAGARKPEWKPFETFDKEPGFMEMETGRVQYPGEKPIVPRPGETARSGLGKTKKMRSPWSEFDY